MTIDNLMPHVDEATLNEYLDGALADARRHDVTRHLDRCQSCRARLQELQSLFAVLNDVHDRAVAPDLASRIVAEAEVQQAPPWLQPVLLAQLTVALLALLWLAPAFLPSLLELSQLLAPVQSITLTQWLPALSWPSLNEIAPLRSLADVLPPPTLSWATYSLLGALAWLVANRILLKRLHLSR